MIETLLILVLVQLWLTDRTIRRLASRLERFVEFPWRPEPPAATAVQRELYRGEG